MRLAAIAVLAATLTFTTGAAASGPLQTGVWDTEALTQPRIAASGVTTAYVQLNWSAVAPATRPKNFQADDPADPAYDWTAFDARVQRIVDSGLAPIVDVYFAPLWAERPRDTPGGTWQPAPAEVASFAKAAATRYSGHFEDLPRVRYWQLWAEQNLYFHLNPQRLNGKPWAPLIYRGMLNAFAGGVKSVQSDNLVITGGLAPFTSTTGTKQEWGLGPLAFMRVMLCMSKQLKPTCRARSHFDVWAHHPYTSGGPTHHAYFPDDVSLGDLPKMHRLLVAAYRAGHIASPRMPRFWVTEFSWDTNPPDPEAVPLKLHGRWVAEALYRMWKAGISLVTWLQLRDYPMSVSYEQSGLYFTDWGPKPALRAFRFPFVAFSERNRTLIWLRTPAGTPGRVIVEHTAGGPWQPVATIQTNRYGIVYRHVRPFRSGFLRARFPAGNDHSLAFSLTVPPDRFVNPFGTRPG